MIKYFRKITSLNNLHNKQVSGQIATMLTLVIVGMLVLILITVNIGDVAMKKTAVSNAADSAALQLGSQLSTISHGYVEALGSDKEDCQKTGWCSAIIAAIVAIVAVVVAIVSFGVGAPLALMAIGALAGAIGAAISAGARGLTGKAFWNQVLLGASIGAAIGSAGSLAAPAGVAEAAVGAEGAVIGDGAVIADGAVTADGAVIADGAVTADGTVMADVGAEGATTLQQIGQALSVGYNAVNSALNWLASLPSKVLNLMGIKTSGINVLMGVKILGSADKALTLGQALNIVLSTTSSLYSAKPYVGDRINEAMSQYSRFINSLGDWDGLKEGTFLNALSKVVDDPNDTGTVGAPKDCYINGVAVPVIGDSYDSDGDGDTAESVPCFQYWEERRLQALKDANEDAYGFVTDFWSDMIAFKNYVKTNILKDASAPDYLSRQEIEGADGDIVNFVRSLENAGQGVSFWQVGPTQAEFQEYQDNCPSLTGGCPVDYLKDHGYDEIDSDVDNFNAFVSLVQELESQGLNSAWQYWIDWLYQNPNAPGYDPETDGSYYAIFNNILYGSDVPGEEFRGLYDWKDDINNIESSLTECIIYPNSGAITNAPCKHTYTEQEPYYYATIDSDTDDEFVAVESQIDEMINHVLNFVNELNDLGSQIDQAIMTIGPEFGGYNPVVYGWRDANGEHRVTVQVSSSFKVPKTETEKHGNWWSGESCVVLKNSEDSTGQNTWVRVRREEVGAADRPVGILGFWRTGGGAIEKTTHVSYNENQVKLVNN
jgi:hypothetical protein